ncbi:MAG: hypothetical protein AAGD11_04240 [Planctomycetota bacterium]
MSRLAHNVISASLAGFYLAIALVGHALHDHGISDHAHVHDGNAASCCFGVRDGSAEVSPLRQPSNKMEGSTCPCSCTHHDTDKSHLAESARGGSAQQRLVISEVPRTCLGCELISQLAVGFYEADFGQADQKLISRTSCEYLSPLSSGTRRACLARGPPAVS